MGDVSGQTGAGAGVQSEMAQAAPDVAQCQEQRGDGQACRTVVVATGNAHKVVEIEAIPLQQHAGDALCLHQGAGRLPRSRGDGRHLRGECVHQGASRPRGLTGLPAVADDSGLVVDALGGAPGVYSARYARVHGDDAANNAKLLSELRGRARLRAHGARFTSCVAYVDSRAPPVRHRPLREARVGFEERGEHGFGYDPLFLPDDTPGKTMASAGAPGEERHLAPLPCAAGAGGRPGGGRQGVGYGAGILAGTLGDAAGLRARASQGVAAALRGGLGGRGQAGPPGPSPAAPPLGPAAVLHAKMPPRWKKRGLWYDSLNWASYFVERLST